MTTCTDRTYQSVLQYFVHPKRLLCKTITDAADPNHGILGDGLTVVSAAGQSGMFPALTLYSEEQRIAQDVEQ